MLHVWEKGGVEEGGINFGVTGLLFPLCYVAMNSSVI